MFTKPGVIHSGTTMIKKHYGKLILSDAKQMTSHVSEPMGFGKGWSGL
jgi:integrase